MAELTDEQLLVIAEEAIHADDIADAHAEGYPLELSTVDLLSVQRAAIAADRRIRPHPTPTPPADGEAIGPEWRPCVKLPITVHVRDQRPGEARVSTREGITRVRPDDLIMRGVHGEEYPIGRDLFNRTYRLGAADPGDSAPAPAADGEREEREELAAWVEFEADNAQELGCATIYDHDRLRWVAGYLRQPAPAPVPVPVAERPWERPGWCDTEGRCWWGDGKTAWLLDDPKPWALIDKIGIYLLPHWAIPTPTEPTKADDR